MIFFYIFLPGIRFPNFGGEVVHPFNGEPGVPSGTKMTGVGPIDFSLIVISGQNSQKP
jgi:hypothetical protein